MEHAIERHARNKCRVAASQISSYTHLVNFQSNEYHTAIAKNVQEARQLAEAGYEPFDVIEDIHIYRRRK